MPKNLEELARMIARRDGLTYNEGVAAVHDCQIAMESAFLAGDLDGVEDALRTELGLEPDYLDLFIM